MLTAFSILMLRLLPSSYSLTEKKVVRKKRRTRSSRWSMREDAPSILRGRKFMVDMNGDGVVYKGEQHPFLNVL
jgi:hypothetical protein